MKQYILCLQRDMQGEFTFMQHLINDDSTVTHTVQLKGWFELSFGKSTVVACEVLNYKEGMDLDDMILQHPYSKDHQLKYIGHYQFK